MDIRYALGQITPNLFSVGGERVDPASDFSSYPAMVATWRGDLPPPDEAEILAIPQPSLETELEMVERFLTKDPVKRREIKAEAKRRSVTPKSIVDGILAET